MANQMNLGSIATLLPEFSGNPGENIMHFLKQFNDLIQIVNVQDPVKLTILKTKLKNDALQYVIENIHLRDETQYTLFCEKLQEKYAPKPSFEGTQQFFLTLTQGENQNVTEFAGKIKNAAEQYIQAAELHTNRGAQQLTQKMMLNKFIDGLYPELQLEVRKESPISFDGAVETAKRIERAIKMTKNVSNGDTHGILVNKIMEIQNDYNNQMKQLNEKIQNMQLTHNNTTTKFCEICRTQTHMTQECRRRNYGTRAQNNVHRQDYNTYRHPQNYNNYTQRNFSANPNNNNNVRGQNRQNQHQRGHRGYQQNNYPRQGNNTNRPVNNYTTQYYDSYQNHNLNE